MIILQFLVRTFLGAHIFFRFIPPFSLLIMVCLFSSSIWVSSRSCTLSLPCSLSSSYSGSATDSFYSTIKQSSAVAISSNNFKRRISTIYGNKKNNKMRRRDIMDAPCLIDQSAIFKSTTNILSSFDYRNLWHDFF